MQSTRIYTIILLTSFLFPATLFSQVFDSGPSDPDSFGMVVNLPGDSFQTGNVDVPGLTDEMNPMTVQLNVSDNTFGFSNVNINEGVELNLELGMDDEGLVNLLTTTPGAEVNISGGRVNTLVVESSLLNISGGEVGILAVLESSTANLFGTDFALDGVLVDGLVLNEAFTIDARASQDPDNPDDPVEPVTLSGVFVDGTEFSFDLFDFFNTSNNDQVDGSSTLTVTAVPEPSSIVILLFGCGLAGLRRTRSAA